LLFCDSFGVLCSGAYISSDSTELVLASGQRLGHRSLARYYKQNPFRQIETRDSRTIRRLMNEYRALGYYDHHQREEDRLRTRVAERKRLQSEFDLRSRIGQKANSLQHHYREQVLF